MSATRIDETLVFGLLPPRPAESHKGAFGRALCLCGSRIYRGAALLAAEGALRSGAGIVQLASVEEVLAAACVRLPECTLLPLRAGESGGPDAAELPRLLAAAKGASALLLGCGLTASADTAALARGLLPAAEGAVVLDADGLNALAGAPLPQTKRLILTPHPGEMARLTGKTVAGIEADRPAAALEGAARFGGVLVLKGHRTLVACPDGRLYQNTTGNAGLARGGSGDALAGIITGLAAAGLAPDAAAVCGVWLHGAAADRAALRRGQTGMLPQDIFAELGGIFAENGR